MVSCVFSTPIQSNPIQSNPIQSNPIQSNPIQSNPIQSNPFQSIPIQSKRALHQPPRASMVVGASLSHQKHPPADEAVVPFPPGSVPITDLVLGKSVPQPCHPHGVFHIVVVYDAGTHEVAFDDILAFTSAFSALQGVQSRIQIVSKAPYHPVTHLQVAKKPRTSLHLLLNGKMSSKTTTTA